MTENLLYALSSLDGRYAEATAPLGKYFSEFAFLRDRVRVELDYLPALAKAGLIALPMDFIDVTSVDLSDFSSMYWGLGAQILRTAKFIKERPQYFGLHLTNFGCGPDSFIEHFYKHVMGDKPYLILELDEHTAVAGVMTRLAAYKNVIDNILQKERLNRKSDGKVEDLKPWIPKRQAVSTH